MIDMLNYVNSLVEKTAAEAIAGLAANYEEAIFILKSRFGNKQMIINKHMESLLNMTPVTSNQDLRGLRRLYDSVEVLRVWRQIGDKIEHYISCRRNFLIPWKIDLRVVVFHSSCRRVLRFVVI